jgi:HPt (histidine-containing phosphotransfer) domain-containing protein
MTTTAAPLSKMSCPQSGAAPLLSTADDSARPLLDYMMLEKLRADLREHEVWRVMVRNFITGLPLRIESLRAALTTGDAAGAREAVQSLQAACQMVGAERLAVLALHLEMAQREGTRLADPSIVLPRLAVAHLPRIKERAGQTTYALETHLNAARRPRSIGSRP